VRFEIVRIDVDADADTVAGASVEERQAVGEFRSGASGDEEVMRMLPRDPGDRRGAGPEEIARGDTREGEAIGDGLRSGAGAERVAVRHLHPRPGARRRIAEGGAANVDAGFEGVDGGIEILRHPGAPEGMLAAVHLSDDQRASPGSEVGEGEQGTKRMLLGADVLVIVQRVACDDADQGEVR
jgi:hypothetical protein